MVEKITPEQSRGARAMLGLSQAGLAGAAQVGKQTVVDFERGARTPYRNNLAAIQRALEAAGVEFLPNNGLRLKSADKIPVRNPKPEPSGSSNPDQGGGGAPRPRRSPTPKAAPRSKLEQIRALREQGAR